MRDGRRRWVGGRRCRCFEFLVRHVGGGRRGADEGVIVAVARLDDRQREVAMRRWVVLRAHLEDGVPLRRAAQGAGVPARTVQRWLAGYRTQGLAGLAPARRSDRGARRFPAELVHLIEGLAVREPPCAVAFIHRQVVEIAGREGWPAPSYATVQARPSSPVRPRTRSASSPARARS